jgi:hypothetical protein
LPALRIKNLFDIIGHFRVDTRLSTLFRLLRVCTLSAGSFRRCQHAQCHQSQLQIHCNYLLPANNSDSVRVHFGFCSFQVIYIIELKIRLENLLKPQTVIFKQIFGLFQSEHKQKQYIRTRLFFVRSVSHELWPHSRWQ